MRYKNTFIIITFSMIILLGLTLRFYHIEKNPPGLYLDEAAQGVNAYLILKTGKDEFDKNFPIIFRSFNDFKTPIYTYLSIPFIKMFGLNVFSIRILSAVSGTLTLVFVYLLINRVYRSNHATELSVITTCLLAISPWHIFLSRGAFEVTLSSLFLISGLYFFYTGLEKPKLLYLSAILLSLCITAYHAQRIIIPIILIFLYLNHKKRLRNKILNKHFIVSLILGLIVLIPTFSISLTPGFSARAIGLNIFSKFGLAGSVKEFLSIYLSYFSPRFMFNLGDSDQKMLIPELSTFFFWQFPFYIYGFYKIIRSKEGDFRSLIILQFVISPFG